VRRVHDVVLPLTKALTHPLDVVFDIWRVGGIKGQIYFVRQKQVVDLVADFQHQVMCQIRSPKGQVYVGTWSEITFGSRAIDKHPVYLFVRFKEPAVGRWSFLTVRSILPLLVLEKGQCLLQLKEHGKIALANIINDFPGGFLIIGMDG